MKKREEIDVKYKWNFADYYTNDEEWQKAYKKIETQIAKLKSFNNKLISEENILKFLKLDEKCSIELESLYIYANCKRDVDVSNNIAQAMVNKVDNLVTQYAVAVSFAMPQLSQLDMAFLTNLLNNDKFADYSKTLRGLIRKKPHIIDESSEKLLSMMTNFSDDFSQNHTNFLDGDLKYKKVKDSKGELHSMTNSMASIYLNSPDRVLRLNAYKELKGALGRYNNFLTSNYLGEVKKEVFFARARKYSSSLEGALYSDEIPVSVYHNVILNVEKNLSLEHRYFDIKKRYLKLKDFSLADVYYNPTKVERKYSYDEGVDIVCKALGLLGEDYVAHIKHIIQNNMIDVYPSENKVYGGYQTMATKKTPRILLNYTDEYEDVSTLAHELGHAMHSVYSDKYQSATNSKYPIFLAEIASTVNELLLNDYMIAHSKTVEEKLVYVSEALSNFHSTIFRQTMFADFELKIYNKVEQNEELSSAVLNETYLNLVKKYFGENVDVLQEVQYEWSGIPHFYNNFYVYQYATGKISAINIVENLKKGKISVQDYKNFLSAGGTEAPIELLKTIQVDLNSEKPFEVAFDYLKTKLNEYEELTTK